MPVWIGGVTPLLSCDVAVRSEGPLGGPSSNHPLCGW